MSLSFLIAARGELAFRSAFNQRGLWWNSGASHMNQAFPKSFFDRLGLVLLLDTR
jgi:RNA-directed DNA polymerase